MRSQEQCLPSKPGTEPQALRLDISGIVRACSQGTTQDLGGKQMVQLQLRE